MTPDDVAEAIAEFRRAATIAMEAGFDGVEIHGANGYLIEQFLNPLVNQRTDGYGGSMERRNRLALEIARAVVAAIGRDRVGIRLSPYGVFNGTAAFPEVEAQYLTLVHSLSALGLLYLHLVDHSSMGAPPVPADFKLKLRDAFDGVFILSGGFDHASAEQALLDKRGDLIAFGRPFLANPDLVARMRKDAPLNPPIEATFYVPGAKGYTDYPTLAAQAV
jgi:N-ethylmaleimide reductase